MFPVRRGMVLSKMPDWARVPRGALYRRIYQVEQARIVQGTTGNFDASEYMRGLYNGLELASAILTDRLPRYKEIEDMEE
jgi:hypothetical protein